MTKLPNSRTERPGPIEVLAAGLVVLGAAVACGGTGVSAVNEPSTGETAGNEAQNAYFKAKCKSDIGDCLADAGKQCGGEYTVIHKESHAGGLLADVLPGPVTWYTVTFRCGAAAQEVAAAAQQDALRAFVMPRCDADWDGRCGLLTDKLEFGVTIDSPALGIDAATRHEGGGLLRRAASACREEAEALSEGCRRAFGRSLTKLLRARYPRAGDQRLTGWCEQNLEQCDPAKPEVLRILELDFLAAHDRAVFSEYKASLQAGARRDQADAARFLDSHQQASEEDRIRQARGEAVQRALDSMKQDNR